MQIAAASGAQPPETVISSAKCFYYYRKKYKITTVNVLLLLPHFCTYFSLLALIFVGGDAEIFLALRTQCTLTATSLAVDHIDDGMGQLCRG